MFYSQPRCFFFTYFGYPFLMESGKGSIYTSVFGRLVRNSLKVDAMLHCQGRSPFVKTFLLSRYYFLHSFICYYGDVCWKLGECWGNSVIGWRFIPGPPVFLTPGFSGTYDVKGAKIIVVIF